MYTKVYEEWLASPYYDEETKKELRGIAGDDQEIKDRFFKSLEFGTAGMRGVIGAGINRINKYIVRKATQGFANYIKQTKKNDYSIVIAYDSRYKSQEFAKEAALVMAANGIKAYTFSDLRTTPELSYSVRNLKADGGIMITASHNPPEYNGYKVYGDDGCQLVPHLADQLVQSVEAITDLNTIQLMTEEEASEKGLFQWIDEDMDKQYIDMVKSMARKPDLFEKYPDYKVVYSPLHGTGGMSVTRTMDELGFKGLIPVKEQMVPDHNFTTVPMPNPEDVKAFELGLKYAKEHNAELVIATDPDCDRVGLVVKNNDGAYVPLNGNQIGALLTNYLLSSYETLPENPIVISTIVTSGLARAVAENYGAEYQETLTGFKFIGEKIRKFEDGSKNFIIGFEESYGYLAGTEVRDKDAVSATMLVIEMALDYKSRGMTILEGLEDIYKRLGYYKEDLHAMTLKGAEGMEEIKRIITHFRSTPLETIGGKKVAHIMDCLETEKTGLPKSNVLKYILEDGSWVAVRPSGTEPKLKFYFSVKSDSLVGAEAGVEELKKDILAKI
jgi:phosphoglucomutase